MKKAIIILTSMIGLVILAGMFKFNILSGLDGYDVDGNKIKEKGYVIETVVDSPDDCTELEKYDAEHGVCFIECDTPKQCDAIEKQLDNLLDSLSGEYEDFSKDFKEFNGDVRKAEEKAEIIYNINKNENFVITYGTENAKHVKIKNWLADISPDDFSNLYLGRLIILTDTEDDSAAFVAPMETENTQQWDVFVNMKSLNEDGEKEMIFTLVHEFAHILTLNKSQMDVGIEENSCPNYFVPEGCLSEQAYLNAFYQKFWQGSDFNVEVEDSLDNYDINPDAFVTEYAATNPGEDIAETFATFVFKKQSATDTIAEQKLAFFYVYPELAEIRKSVRNVFKPFVRKRMEL